MRHHVYYYSYVSELCLHICVIMFSYHAVCTYAKLLNRIIVIISVDTNAYSDTGLRLLCVLLYSGMRQLNTACREHMTTYLKLVDRVCMRSMLKMPLLFFFYSILELILI